MWQTIDPSVPEYFSCFVAKGDDVRVTGLNKFGRNGDIDSAAAEDVWDGGGLYTYQTSAVAMEILSVSGDDTSDGTGARTVTIYGTDGDYLTVSETVTLNGATPVTLANTYFRVWRMVVQNTGTGLVNAGNLTVRTVSGSTTQAQVLANNGQTLMALFTVPTNQHFVLSNYYASATLASGASNVVTINLFFCPRDKSWQLKHTTQMNTGVSPGFNHRFTPEINVGQNVDIRIIATVGEDDTVVAAGFGGYLYVV